MTKKPKVLIPVLLGAAVAVGTATVVNRFIATPGRTTQNDLVVETTHDMDDETMDDQTINDIEMNLSQTSDSTDEPTDESFDQTTKKERQKYGSVTSITTASQVKGINIQTEPMVLKFYTNWCPACIASTKPYEELAQEFDSVHFYAVNIEENGMLNALNDAGVTPEPITRIPTFVLWKPGNPPHIVNGFYNLKSAIETYF